MITAIREPQQIDITADAERFKALGSPSRLALLALIEQHHGTLNVQDLQERLGEMLGYEVKQPTVSHHLAILARAGLIESVRKKQEMYYRLRVEGLVCCMDALAALARMGREEVPV